MFKDRLCKNCKHWKSEQAELDYNSHSGICTCFRWKFVVQDNADVCVLDRGNRSEKYRGVQRFENQNKEVPIGAPEKSRYCFVTDENFGCIHFNKK